MSLEGREALSRDQTSRLRSATVIGIAVRKERIHGKGKRLQWDARRISLQYYARIKYCDQFRGEAVLASKMSS